MIEPYQWLQANAATLGLLGCHLGPCSADLTLGPQIRAYREQAQSLYTLAEGVPLTLHAGWFYLVSTHEVLCVPPTHCAFVHMRSSLARQGLGHKMAGLIDPGFCGQVTLELEASLDVTVLVGAPLVQVTFHRLMAETTRPYAGRYQGQRGPTEAYHA